MNIQRIINSSIDCVSQFRASKHPLKNIAADIIKARKLNSRERSVFLDLVFAWARESNLVAKFLKSDMRFSDGLSNQQKDTLALNILVKPASDLALRLRYEEFLEKLGDRRYVLALGDVIADELIASHPEQATAIAKGLWKAPSKYLAFDIRVFSREQVIERLASENIKVSSHPMSNNALKIEGVIKLEELPKDLQENIWFMDAGSQIIANCLKPKAHERVLDMCVGEGGKARIIAMNNCDLVALDIDEGRLTRAKKRLAAFKLEYICADGRLSHPALKEKSFDWILIDAPCSGSGTLRRHPDLIYRLNKAQLVNYQKLQRELLTSATKLLKPGAKLIYATCSLFNSENQQQIDGLLATNANLKPYELPDLHKTCIELIPHIHDCDGFYLAALTKTRE